MSLFVKVEIDAGTSEGTAAQELVRLADRARITVEASFNGVTMRARPGQPPEDVLREYERERRLQSYPVD